MALPPDLPIVDHHCHLSPNGDGVRAAQRFREGGGTHLFLATQNYDGRVPERLDDYARQFETTESLARAVTAETGVRVYLVLAPYPIDLIGAAGAIGLSAALQLQQEALELAGRWVREHRAVAIGEVGRPHFAVDSTEIRDAGEAIFDRALETAREADCPAIVHCEDIDPAGLVALGERARRVGLAPRRIVKHYARSRLAATGEELPAKSYLARRELVREVLEDPGPWFLETDYLDDPRRPGAVLDLATVPRRAEWIAAQGRDAVERLRVPFESSFRLTYGWVPQIRDGRNE